MHSLYLAWMDFRNAGMRAPDLHDTLIRKAGLWLDYGPKFGHEDEGFMRINLACARSVVDDAIAHLQQTFGP